MKNFQHDLTSKERIKKKIFQINPNRWWGDDFDVRFYLLNQLKYKGKTLLDVGGGIGIICSELYDNNLKINLDLSFNDLLVSKNKLGNRNNICASMSNLPFKENSIDVVICANIFEIAKNIVYSKNNTNNNNSITLLSILLKEINTILNNNGELIGTTPNNVYYKTNKLTYQELKNSLDKDFYHIKVLFYNTHKKLSKHRKLNLANLIPKLSSKFSNQDEIILKLIKNNSKDNYSVSFYFEAKKRK